MSDQVTLLKSYLLESGPGGLHARWRRAAQDPDITTDFLFDLALLSIQQDGATDNGVIFGPALSVLHKRNDEEVLQRSLALLTHVEPTHRELGAQVLRALGDPGPEELSTPCPKTVIEALHQCLLIEDDDRLCCVFLEAIGSRRHWRGTSILLSFHTDPRDEVRTTVADYLTAILTDDSDPLRADVFAALLQLAQDPVDDIQWSVFWDIAEFPELFTSHRWAFLKLAMATATAPPAGSPPARDQAVRAYEALKGEVASEHLGEDQ